MNRKTNKIALIQKKNIDVFMDINLFKKNMQINAYKCFVI